MSKRTEATREKRAMKPDERAFDCIRSIVNWGREGLDAKQQTPLLMKEIERHINEAVAEAQQSQALLLEALEGFLSLYPRDADIQEIAEDYGDKEARLVDAARAALASEGERS